VTHKPCPCVFRKTSYIAYPKRFFLFPRSHRLPNASYSPSRALLTLHAMLFTEGGLFFAVLDCINRLKRPSHRCRLLQSFHADIAWWSDFLPTFNGRRMMLDFRQTVYVQTDVSFQGFGAVCPHDWVTGSWSPSRYESFLSLPSHSYWSSEGHAIDRLLLKNINYLELFPVLVAARRMGYQLDKQTRLCRTDKTQTVCIVNKGTCKSPPAMSWLREIFWLSIKYNFHIRSRHLTGSQNIHADALSRLLGFPSPVKAHSFLPS